MVKRCPAGKVGKGEKCIKKPKTDWMRRTGYSVELNTYRKWVKKQSCGKLRQELGYVNDATRWEIVANELRKKCGGLISEDDYRFNEY